MSETNYVVFDRTENGLPKLMTVAEVKRSDWEGLAYVVYADLPYRAQDNGLPAKGELGRVAKIEDALEASLKDSGVRHLGHITGGEKMRVVFRSSKPVPGEVSVRMGLFRQVRVALESRQDTDWSWYEREMAPTPLERDLSSNYALLATLKQRGDRASQERPVEFAAHFPSAEGRTAFMQTIAPEGYAATKVGTWEPDDDPNDFWCEVQISTNIEPAVIAKRCAYLREQADILGGEFDGWQTPITS